MKLSVPVTARLDVDTTTKAARLVWSVPAADGEGDVEVASQDLTALSQSDKRRLRHLLDAKPAPPLPVDPPGRD